LGFSAGVDSTALFFYLLKKDIPFDLAIVNYNLRENSKKEVEYAKELAKKYNKKIFIKEVKLEKFNEKIARDIRYNFFEEIISKHNYTTLILAHQLNDRFEWMLMQLSKGAGLKEIIAMNEYEKRDFYTIWRPFYLTTRDEILEFLKKEKIKYFIDESNFDISIKRNYFRNHFSNKFIKEFKDGIKKSFIYLQKDKELLLNGEIFNQKKLYYFKSQTPELDIKKVDIILKKLKILPTKAQKDEILKREFNCVIQGKIAIEKKENFIYIAPYKKIKIDKKIRDKFRKLKIPPKIRGYFFSEIIS
jgi:tRNA(Ile)-lysidine synthase